ncbi:DUF3618 domain-containing protein [Propioniciclava soli]|uniref:DUF3618 domain-containing protein n=1 Tax=Propioniciclava soli TaxID=2775081 RepID=A0ABZ3C430_9ACTN|nr:DUF3618 domain-containing protein [Propioniciclava soli]
MRTKEEIQAEIAAARARLASNVEGLITQAHPRAVAARTVQDAKGLLSSEVDAVKSQFVDPTGEPRYERIGALGLAVAASVAFLFVVRSIAQG